MAAVHESILANVTLAVFFSITKTGSGLGCQAPLVHESFSANAGCVFAITGIGSGTDYQVPLSERSIRTIETTTHGK